MKKPEKTCTFQGDWYGDDEKFECGLTNGRYWCKKEFCPFWKKQRVEAIQTAEEPKLSEDLSFE